MLLIMFSFMLGVWSMECS